MKITELLQKSRIVLNVAAKDKQGVLEELSQLLIKDGIVTNQNEFMQALLKREEEGTTGIGEGIAIPHGRSRAVARPALALGLTHSGLDYESLDGQPVHIVFMIAVPENADQEHLHVLAALSRLLMDEEVRKGLLAAQSADEILALIDSHSEPEEEQGVAANGQTKEQAQAESARTKKIVAITACPTGIAHTYMAAESLEKAAKQLGYQVKVETQGSVGAENVLSGTEIQEADAVIIAADKKVELDRFHGKRVIEVSVSSAIKDPGDLIAKSLQAPVFAGGGDYADQVARAKEEKKAAMPAFYKHLMNGVSHMIPLVTAGGLLIAICFAFGITAFKDPHSPYYTIAKAFMDIGGGSAFALMIPILSGFIAMSIADRPGLTPGLVGGMLASSIGAGFLGGIISGFLAGYVAKWIRDGIRLPKNFQGLMPVLIIPFFSTAIVGLIMVFVLGTPIKDLMQLLTTGLKNMGASGSIGLGLLLGAMMAFDMGGPINKVAYTFATGMLASQTDVGYSIMAAVMAAGMVPPLGMALSTFIARNRYSAEEREAGKAAAVLGIAFITEGAIPFAARDPFRVIPSIVIGSAVTGALSMLFHCTLRAPHGGIFVLAVPQAVGNVGLYALSILIGAIVSGVLVSILKKPISA
ncbi:fructose-specific PTS transporter subunit EIIC [Fodinisporobacter ferrooxydans]|uniref:Fructose-specific PTS transporter subunit EIIC n=1 Tax=Fodinisporobacter ferrooxydans TaxID=2901836 RepID=A0ABY4CQ32_9BACL|nr:fructose-specific PTS transporter subunit EIIC [Alicyclobacillaceae bacterium MYW30-H2]